MAKNQGRNVNVIYGICTNTSGKDDGTPCLKCQNKEIQVIRSTKDFVCEECGERLTKTNPPKSPIPWAKIAIAVVAVLVIVGFLLFKPSSEPTSPPVTKVNITVTSSDPSMGTVSGGGTYDKDESVMISASPKNGCIFVSWDDGNTENPRKVFANGNKSYSARFNAGGGNGGPNPTPVKYTITVVSSDNAKGTVRGGGTFESYKNISIEAVAKDGYQFDSWNDGNVENPRSVIVGRDCTYVANFEKLPSSKPSPPGGNSSGKGTKQYSCGKYVGKLKNGIPEDDDGKMTYSKDVQIARHDTKNSAHYAKAGDYFVGSWGNGDIVSGTLYSKDGQIKEKIFAPKRYQPYDLNNDCQ